MEIPGFKILSQLGSGGMATVYLAVQEALGRQVAIKVMKSAGGDATLEDRFLREGQNLARLNHHNIAAIYNIARSDDYFYFAMELLEGGTLSEHLKQGISITFAINVILQIGSALEAAHRLGIVHRDLKPSNIIFRDAMTPVLTDFGIAKDTTSDTRLTGTGMMVGTPHYMSPEQIMGRNLDGRSDVYSLGVVFYELLTGKLPFDAEGDQVAFSVAMKHMNEPIPRLPETVAAFQDVIDQALAKDPDNRFPSANAMCFAVRQVAATDEDIQSRMGDETILFGSDEFAAPIFTPSGGFTAGGGWVAGKTPTGGQPAPGEFPATPKSGQSSQVTLQHRFKHLISTQRTKVVSAALAAIVLGILAAVFWPDSLDPETRGIVEGFMMKADRQVSAGRFVGSGDDNALSSLQAIFQVAPDYKPAMRLVEEITDILEAEALVAIANQELQEAADKIEQGQRFDPDNEGLLAAQDRLALAVADARRAEEVVRLLAKASLEMQEERWLLSRTEGAAVTLQQLLELDPTNERAINQLAEVKSALLREFRGELENQTAEEELVARLDLLNAVLGEEPEVSGLVEELQDELVLRVNRQRARQLVASAEPLLEQQNYYSEDPAEPSALPILLEALELDSDNQRAAEGMNQIATHYAELAGAALENDELELASDHIEIGLLADSRHEPLLTLRNAVDTAVQERAGQLATLLNQAQDLINQGRIITPEGSNALTVLQTLLTQAPDQPEARSLLDRLPSLVNQQVANLITGNEFDEAKALAAAANTSFPDRDDFKDLPSRIETLEEAFQSGQQIQALLAVAQDSLAAPSFTSIELQRGVGAFQGVLDLEPNNAEARRGLQQLEQRGQSEALASIEAEDIEAAERYAEAMSEAFPATAGTIRDGIAERRAILEERAEQERIANSRPVLLQALPWGRLESVKRVGGETESLPGEPVTPVELLLLPGRYEVAFSHPDYADAVTLSVLVTDSGKNEVTAVFEEMKAKDFFAEVKF